MQEQNPNQLPDQLPYGVYKREVVLDLHKPPVARGGGRKKGRKAKRSQKRKHSKRSNTRKKRASNKATKKH
jgi:hypothetical protein